MYILETTPHQCKEIIFFRVAWCVSLYGSTPVYSTGPLLMVIWLVSKLCCCCCYCCFQYFANTNNIAVNTFVHKSLYILRKISGSNVYCNYITVYKYMGFLGGTSGKEPTSQCRRLKKQAQSLGLEDPLEEDPMATNSTLYSCLGKSHGQRGLAGYSPYWSQRVGHDWSDLVRVHLNVYIILLGMIISLPQVLFTQNFTFFLAICAIPVLQPANPVGGQTFGFLLIWLLAYFYSALRYMPCFHLLLEEPC